MKGFLVRRRPGEAAMAVARRQAGQLTLVRRRAQPTAVYIARLTATAVFACLLALQLPGGSTRSVLAPLTALLVVQATLFHTIRSAIQRVVGVTAGVLAAVAVAAYVPFSWWVLGLLIAATLGLGMVLRLREDILEVPISAMLIFSVDSHAAATSRITETLVGAAAGLAAGLVLAPLRVQPAKDAVGDVSRQMADLFGQMADGLAQPPDSRRAAEWLERTRALRGEIERLDDALSQAEESVRLNPRRLRFTNPAAGLREGVDTLEPPPTCACWPARWSTAPGSTASTARSGKRRPAPGWPPYWRSCLPPSVRTDSGLRPSRRTPLMASPLSRLPRSWKNT
jgi:gas vesicle protein